MLIPDELQAAWRDEPRQHRLALAVIVVIGVGLRLLYIAQPMRSDEAVAYMSYVRQPWPDAMTAYMDPNNHVLYTLLAKAAVGVFGPAPWVMRLPALVVGVLTVPATYAMVRVFYGGRAAIVATAFVAASGVLVLYSTTARGFSIIVLCFLLLVLIGVRLLRGASRRHWIAFAVIAALGLWTMPAMIFPLGTVALWLALTALTALTESRERDVRRLLIVLAAIAGLSVLIYAPMLAREGGGTLQSMAARNADWLAFFIELSLSVGSLALSWSLGLPPILAVVLLVFALLALKDHASLSQLRIGLPLAAFVFCSWLLVVTHRAPQPRVWLWLLPLALALAAAGMIAALEREPRVGRLVVENAGLFAMGLAVLCTMLVTMSSAVLLSRESGAFRDAERAADALKSALREGDLIVTGEHAGGPLDFYLHRKGVDRSHLAQVPSRARRVFVVVDGGSGQTLDRVSVPREVRDTSRFIPPSVAATLPASRIYVFERRHAARP